MTADEQAATMGGVISPDIWVVYHVCHTGKEGLLVGDFRVCRHATDEEILAGAVAQIDEFYARHYPDGTCRPEVVNFIRGSLRIVYDDMRD